MASRLALLESSDGWQIALEMEDGQLHAISFPWESRSDAEAFMAITRPDLDFVPSRLPEAP